MTLPTFDNAQDLGQFINSIYIWSIGIVGLAVFIQFIRAGLTYLLAAGNASTTGKAKEMMQHAVLGAILLLSAYLILNVINPDLTRTDLFNLNEIAKQIPKQQDTSGSTNTINCTNPTTPAEKTLCAANVVGNTNRDVSGMSQKTAAELQYMKSQCNCEVKILQYIQQPGGEFVALAPNEQLAQYAEEKQKIGEVSAPSGYTGTTYKDTTTGTTYTVYRKTCESANTACIPDVGNITMRVPG